VDTLVDADQVPTASGQHVAQAATATQAQREGIQHEAEVGTVQIGTVPGERDQVSGYPTAQRAEGLRQLGVVAEPDQLTGRASADKRAAAGRADGLLRGSQVDRVILDDPTCICVGSRPTGSAFSRSTGNRDVGPDGSGAGWRIVGGRRPISQRRTGSGNSTARSSVLASSTKLSTGIASTWTPRWRACPSSVSTVSLGGSVGR
jgi:hypothetical protein